MGHRTGIEGREAVIGALSSGKRPSVIVKVKGYEYQNTAGVTGGKYLISVNAAGSRSNGLRSDDAIDVTLTIADKPHSVEFLFQPPF